MLEELPARMDRLESQIVQLRAENSAEHSAMRQEIGELRQDIGEIRQEIVHMRKQIDDSAEQTVSLRSELQALDTKMQARHDELGRHMRVLHEDLVGRIAIMNEARPRSRKPKA